MSSTSLSNRSCSIRAIWILNSQQSVIFSRKFVVVEKRWSLACARDNGDVLPLFPTDPELSSAFSERKTREGSVRGFGIRLAQSSPGTDSWVDDPVTRHIISLRIKRHESDIKGGGEGKVQEFMLWPLVLHVKGGFYILVLPLIEPQQLKEYDNLCTKLDCGSSVGEENSFSSLLLNLPCITGAFVVAHTIGDIVTGDLTEPEVLTGSSFPVGGLLDSLTGSIGISGISSRSKPTAAPVASTTASGSSAVSASVTDGAKITSRAIDKEALLTFISIAMPFGSPIDLNFSNISAIKNNGFSSSDVPPADIKQPAWKPYLYKGKQRTLFTVHETLSAAMYDRDEIPDSLSISGQLNCRAELEGLPDVSLPLTGLKDANVEALSFHHCVQISEHGEDRQALIFSPPLGNFVLMRYEALCGLNPPVQGFYQLSMVSETEGAFLFRLRLMEGYKAPFSMEFCTVTMPFPRRRVASFDGNPSTGTASMSEHALEWKIVTTGRSITGKSIEPTFSGTIKFLPWTSQNLLSKSTNSDTVDEDSDFENESANGCVNIEESLMEKLNKDLRAVDLEEPFTWEAYSYAKVSFKILGGTISGISIDPKSVSIYPAGKVPVELSMQVSSGDYILWNTLGKCPSATLNSAR